MKNKLPDLNDHLFAQLERMGDDDLDSEALEREIKRSEKIVALSDQIVGVAKVRLAAAKLGADYGHEVQAVVYPMIEKKVGP